MRITFDIPDITDNIAFTLVMHEGFTTFTYTDCVNAKAIGKELYVVGSLRDGYRRLPRTESDWDQIDRSEIPNT